MIKEKDIIELRNWLDQVHSDFNNDKIDPKHYESLGKMVNILYGRRAKPNKLKRNKL